MPMSRCFEEFVEITSVAALAGLGAQRMPADQAATMARDRAVALAKLLKIPTEAELEARRSAPPAEEKVVAGDEKKNPKARG